MFVLKDNQPNKARIYVQFDKVICNVDFNENAVKFILQINPTIITLKRPFNLFDTLCCHKHHTFKLKTCGSNFIHYFMSSLKINEVKAMSKGSLRPLLCTKFIFYVKVLNLCFIFLLNLG